MRMTKVEKAKWSMIVKQIRLLKSRHIDVQFAIKKTEDQLGLKLPKFIIDEIMA